MRVLVVGLLTASPALAEPDARALLIAAARDNGCLLTEGTADLALLPFGVTEEALAATVDAMRAAGEADRALGALRLSAALCDGVPPATVPAVTPQMAEVIAVFRANGCRLQDATAKAKLEAAGIDEDALRRVGPESLALGDLGLMLRDEAAKTIVVTEPLCSAPVVMADPTEPLIRMFRENGCHLSYADAQRLVPDYGLTLEEVDTMSAYLVDIGILRPLHAPFFGLEDCPD